MIKGINLIPVEIQNEWRIKKWRAGILAACAVYVCLLAAVFINQRFALNEKRAEEQAVLGEKDALAAKSSEYALLTRKLTELKTTETELKKRLGVTADLNDKRISWSLILKKLSHDIPDGVWLRALSTSDVQDSAGKKLRFLGSAKSNRVLADFVFKLENSGYFQDSTLSYSQKRESGGSSVYDFEIYATLRKTNEILYEW
ncbi:MAG: PilN domain-containing protein [Deltaproteobacteria bacterium]|nr:PilN domain-containing protein [Deltaproteobacteria bacterium]